MKTSSKIILGFILVGVNVCGLILLLDDWNVALGVFLMLHSSNCMHMLEDHSTERK